MNDSNKNVVFIGGGDVLSGKQDNVFQNMFDDYGSEPLQILCLPIALFNDERKIKSMSGYMEALGAHFHKLEDNMDFKWISKTDSITEIKDKINSSNFLFLSGGDTQFLIDFLTKNGLDEAIRSAYNNGIPIVGSSAGALALAGKGYSFYKSIKKEYQGIGIIHNFIPIVHWEAKCDIKHEKDNTNLLNLEENKGCIITNDADVKVL